jgi:ribosome biogenesis SPOUT family RNA methylase Rps3
MKATQPLRPQDSQLFNLFIFGGILGENDILSNNFNVLEYLLGNVPCEDRTSKIRCFNPSQRRHLGSMQV